MKILAVRSIPLSRTTRSAWRAAGVKFAKREREGEIPDRLCHQYDVLLNLGNSNLRVGRGIRVFNTVDTIRAVSNPLALEATYNPEIPIHHPVIPGRSIVGPHWHKQPGRQGMNKTFHEHGGWDCAGMHGAVQQHIEGDEYRIITVGDKVVQASKKHGAAPNFDYEWIGVEGVRNDGFIPLIKRAIQYIPDSERTVLGFDVIHDGYRPWVIEINTSPGVNDATARRIVDEITR